MAKDNDDQKEADKSKDFADKRTFNKAGTEKHSQHDETDHDEKHRMGQFGGAGDHPRDSGKGRHK